jgi:hypothetical protein
MKLNWQVVHPFGEILEHRLNPFGKRIVMVSPTVDSSCQSSSKFGQLDAIQAVISVAKIAFFCSIETVTAGKVYHDIFISNRYWKTEF